MSLKYKSPLIRSRNASATDGGSSRNAETPSPQTAADRSDAISVYDNVPQPSPVAHGWRGRGCSSPGGFNNPRYGSPRPPRGSPYQWTPPPNRFNNSWSSDINNSGSSLEQNSFSSYKPHFNKYKKQNNWSNEKNDESYFHPSMLEDPWAPLLNNSTNNAV